MIRTFKTTAVAALCAAVVGVGAAGCNADGLDELDKLDALDGTPSTSQEAGEKLLSGTEKIDVAGVKVNVSCAGEAAEGKPVIMLLAGAGDGLDKLAALQKTLSAKHRVCSYDRPGEGTSDKPKGPQTFESAGEVLTAVLDKAAGDHPVVLAGHSLGGLIAARYAPRAHRQGQGRRPHGRHPVHHAQRHGEVDPGERQGPGRRAARPEPGRLQGAEPRDDEHARRAGRLRR
ncbi:alpha/beta fold hydrolase [Nonomuraea salmonea]|uniref:alpha/beta fold hydrolase n=1 Tax=Nonomuraea salmonea TaxID=46181 RepID=UPI002FEA5021